MAIDIKVSLNDMIESCQAIAEYIETENEISYQQSRKTRMAVERELIIIGEAVNNCLRQQPDIALSHAKNIIGFRNIAVHEYSRVDDAVVWKIATVFIPRLLAEAQSLMAKANTPNEA
jgi:uncharacterized protein with HEPN domain